jgi:hypothetical protein
VTFELQLILLATHDQRLRDRLDAAKGARSPAPPSCSPTVRSRVGPRTDEPPGNRLMRSHSRFARCFLDSQCSK